MIKVIRVLMLFFISIQCANIGLSKTVNDTVLANEKLIEYTGRVDFTDSLAPKFSYSGVSIRASFTGTSIGAILDDDTGRNYYNVIIDGEISSVIQLAKGKREYELAANLTDTQHEIELFKRTEQDFGKTQFWGFILDEGKSLIPLTNKRELFFEFIGNSITCGYGNEGKNGENFVPETENHYLTYAAITSHNFSARHMAVSKSGIGIYRNYDGPASGNPDCMTNLYERIFLYDENPKYNFAIQPDLLFINLGTNDFSTIGGDSALYVSNYLRLIDTIQSKYNKPDIICLLGPMISGTTLSQVRNYLEFISDSANRKDKGNVYFFEMSAQTGDLGIGVHYHPTTAQHRRNAGELTNYIKKLKGWKVSPELISAKTLSAKTIQLKFNTELNTTNHYFSGFSITNESTNFTIKSVKIENSDFKILNISLEESITPASKLFLKYVPGTLESADLIKLKEINAFEIHPLIIN